MKFVIKPLYCMFFLLLINSLCFAQVILRFQPQINSKASRLGDLLLIENDTHHWSNLPIDSHPVAGEVVTKEKILAWMNQRIGKFTSTWQGKTQIRVTQSIQSSGKLLQDKAKAALIKKLGSKYSRIEVESISAVKDSEYTLDNFKASMSLSFPVAKRVCVWLKKDEQRIAIWFRVSAYARVLVAKHNLGYNTLIKNNAFSWKERNIAGLNGQPAQSLPENTWLKSSIEENNILLKSQMKEPPLVIQGQTVKVSFHNNSVSLAMDAVALADGYLGQTIRVKNALNQKSFAVTVTGLQKAEVTS